MALGATVHRFAIQLSDVDRQVYETLDLRVARHPSESVRYLLTRTLAYALSYEEGITFSKGGLSDADEPPISVRDPTGILRAFIDVGSPSADRLHKATKAAERVSVFTHTDLGPLRRDAASRPIHRVADIACYRIDEPLLAALEPKVSRHTTLDITRNEGQLYITVDGGTLEGAVTLFSLAP